MSQKANTAIICLSPYFGGMEMDSIRLAKSLAAHVGVCFVVRHGAEIHKYYGSEAHKDNVAVESVKFHSNFSFAIIFGVRKIIEQYKIRNVIFFGASEMRSLYFSFLNKDINLIIRHGTTKSHPKKDFLHRLIYSKVAWHIAISRHLADNVAYIIPLGKNSRIQVIYPSLRFLPEQIQEAQVRHPETVTLLLVSRIAEGKGHIDAINACQILHDKGIRFRLIFAGELDSNFSGKLDSALSGKPYRTLIEFPGFCENVGEYYKQADIFLYPSKGEGFGNAFAEALAHGLICIAYNNTTFPEFRQAGFDFFMAENGNVASLKSALLAALDYLLTQKTPLLENIELARQTFGTHRETEQLLELLV